jgi:hypothetical protein
LQGYISEDNKDNAKVRRHLEEYCGLDTMGMVDIIDKIYKSLNKEVIK